MKIGPPNVIFLCNYCNKTDHITLLCFVRKKSESKIVYPSSHFYEECHENKMRNMPNSSYFNDHNSCKNPRDIMHSTKHNRT